MTETSAHVLDDPDLKQSLGALTPRESDLLNQAGDRIFNLSRKLADRERELERTKLENTHLKELLEETRMMRGILSDQVQALQRDLDREYEERAELRRLLASLQLQLQALLPAVVRSEELRPAAPPQLERTTSTARSRSRRRQGWLRNVADGLLGYGK